MAELLPWLHMFLDVPRPVWPQAIRFWSAATGWQTSAPRGKDGQFLTLVPPVGDPWLRIQAIPEATSRVHLDLDTADRAQAIARSTAAGARPVWKYGDVQVMQSPGDLLFCHTLADRPRHAERSNPSAVLDQVCIDIPSADWDQEVTFWQTITGRELELGVRPEFAFLGDREPSGGLRILLQRLDSGERVSAHPDFAVANRPAETARHEALGASRLRATSYWTVMRSPDGLTYCLTDRDPTTGCVRR